MPFFIFMMMKNETIQSKRQWRMSNSAGILASAVYYPFTETGSPSNYEIRQHFPLRTFTIENKSSQTVKVILDPAGATSSKEYEIPDGKTLALTNEDIVTFYQVAIENIGGLEINAGEIGVTVRNY